MSGRVLLCADSEERAVDYSKALVLGGVPAESIRVVTPETSFGSLRELAAGAAGLMMAGGDDLHPRHYGEEPLEGAELVIDEAVDRLELELLRGAEEGKTPIWAVCRGMQTLNVYLGGRLFQDLRLQMPSAGDHSDRGAPDLIAHALGRIEGSARFSEVLGCQERGVNSRHHQAVREVAPRLRAVAWADDDVLEAIESADEDWWLRGVQWHPENLTAHPSQVELWRDFAEQVTS